MGGKLVSMLAEGRDLRSLGRGAEVVHLMTTRRRFDEVFDAIFATEPAVRLRAIDSVEKVARLRPEWLRRRQHQLIERLGEFEGHDVQQMHVALLAELMTLTPEQAELLLATLTRWAERDHKWIRTSCMTGIAALALHHPELQPRAFAAIEQILESDPSPSVQKRGMKLKHQLIRSTDDG